MYWFAHDKGTLLLSDSLALSRCCGFNIIRLCFCTVSDDTPGQTWGTKQFIGQVCTTPLNKRRWKLETEEQGCISDILFFWCQRMLPWWHILGVEHLHRNGAGAIPFTFAQLCLPSLWWCTSPQNSDMLVSCSCLIRTFVLYSDSS